MKKGRILFIDIFIILAFISVAFAGLMNIREVTDSSGNFPFTVLQNATVYTKSFPMKSGDYFGLGYKAVSAAGTPNITISLEQSYTLPSTEGSSDSNYVAPEGIGAIATELTSETQHYTNITTVPMPYGRFKVVENGAANDTAVSLRLTTIE